MQSGKESIGLGDIAEMFGGAVKKPVEEKKESPAPVLTAAVLPEPGTDIKVTMAPDIKRLDEFEMPPPIPVEDRKPENIFLHEDTALQALNVFEELRKTLYAEVLAHADKKAVDNMMLRSLEKSAVCHAAIKDCSWSSAGELRTDGSVDTERFMRNISQMTPSEQREKTAEAFAAVTAMRFKSVKTALGPDKYDRIKNSVLNRMKIIEAGFKKGVVKFMTEEVIDKAVRKAGETQ